MNIPPALLQFLGSLVAILALAGLAFALRLGPAPRLEDEQAARAAADEAVSGFDPVDIALDRGGAGALMRDAAGRILLLRQHGSHFAGRVLTGAAEVSLDGDALLIDTAEKRYGAARLEVSDPSAWMQAIEAIQ
ncbi:hypothetical protein [Qipengyuania aquimaris]|uniref:hypothetical protein n=1 Tax=Qipengyuania aquimaris TaxID=255984 RepID=UPI001CD5B402|nr:hypothetical protein [Qipengyuania aquimaris]MCA0903592.1 hypothetical protein [Qipengyuania aquimaris]